MWKCGEDEKGLELNIAVGVPVCHSHDSLAYAIGGCTVVTVLLT